MSQLNVDNLKDRLGANQPAIVGAAKAFVNFDGTGTVAIRDSFNVSSITDNGVGDYTVNFTNAMPDANYSGLALLGSGAVGNQQNVVSITGIETTSFRIFNYPINAATDRAVCCVTIHSN